MQLFFYIVWRQRNIELVPSILLKRTSRCKSPDPDLKVHSKVNKIIVNERIISQTVIDGFIKNNSTGTIDVPNVDWIIDGLVR